MQSAWILVAPGDAGTDKIVSPSKAATDLFVRLTRNDALVIVGVPTICTLITSVTPLATSATATQTGGFVKGVA